MRIKFEDFDPNDPQFTDNMWGVFSTVDNTFRTTTRRGNALNRFSNGVRAKLYRYDRYNARWELVASKDPRNQDPVCTACGGTTEAHPTGWRLNSTGDYSQVTDYTFPPIDQGKYVWERVNGKIAPCLRFHYACVACCTANGWR